MICVEDQKKKKMNDVTKLEQLLYLRNTADEEHVRKNCSGFLFSRFMIIKTFEPKAKKFSESLSAQADAFQ